MTPEEKTSIIAKAIGGRWLLTIAAALCLGAFTVTDCLLAIKDGKDKIPVDPAVIMTLIGVVFASYFHQKGPEDAKNDSPKDDQNLPKQV